MHVRKRKRTFAPMEKTVIIVAGGRGERMGSVVPKQFLPLCGTPVLMHTLRAFAGYDPRMELVVVLPETQTAHWQRLCAEHRFTLPHRIVTGGDTRFHSVRNGLAACATSTALIAVHDGVRPLVTHDTIARCFDCAAHTGAAIPVVLLADSLRQVDESGSHACDRARYRLVQTPQVFRAEVLHRAYAQPFSPAFTDDASVVEATGHPVALVDGTPRNIKLTTPLDLAVAEAVLKNGI